ncbi:MAG: transporter, partial [Deltaproteobacteria bacterium]
DNAKTVLNAFAEVERALLTGEAQQERCARERDYLAAARATESVLGARYARGLTDYAAILDAREARLQAEENVIQAELAVLVSRVDLHRSLGGNWTAGRR